MEEAVYTFKLIDNSYVESTEDSSILSLSLGGFYDGNIEVNFKNFAERYRRIRVSNKILGLAQQLLEKYNLNYSTGEFLSLLAVVQERYFTYVENDYSNTIFEDFENLKKDSSEVFDVLEDYLFPDVNSSFEAVKFSSIKEEISSTGKKVFQYRAFKITNWFVVDDILRGICFAWEINRENFHQRKEAILSDYNPYPVTQGSLRTKLEFTKKIDDKIRTLISGKNEKNRCLGFILNLTQMSYHLKKNSIELDLQKDLEYNLKLVSHKAVEHLVARSQGLLP